MDTPKKEEKPKTEHEKFVDNMLKSADKTGHLKQQATTEANHAEVESALKDIMGKLQKKK